MINYYRCVFLILFVFVWVSPALANSQSQAVSVSRYSTVSLSAVAAQRQPLTAVISLNLNRNATTVLHAIEQVLYDSGYRLSTMHPDKRVNQLFNLPLPKIHRTLGPITVSQALKTLAGSPWELVVDPINRLVTFQLPDTFQNAPLVHIKPVEVVEDTAVFQPVGEWIPTEAMADESATFDQATALKNIKAKKKLTINDTPESLR